jgi:hypothetical protein
MKADAIIGAVSGVTKKWAKQRKREEREDAAILNRRIAMTRRRSVSIKDAAWQTMEEAYLKASAGGTLPAHARQIMYAARGYIMQTVDRPLGKDFDKYFTQNLLPDYIEQRRVPWNVVFDARGHFTEPHTKHEVPLGTLQVRNYLGQVAKHTVPDLNLTIGEAFYPTLGPMHRYGAILFIEKEGFMPLFEAVKLAERYDIAIMSTKGMSVTASRELVDKICSDHDIPLLVLHDFDKSGFSIAGTLRENTRRYQFTNAIKVIDIGLRLDDIDGLETENVHVQSPDAAGENLRQNGATEAEIDFLLHQRVELNALASDQLIALIERKLAEHSVGKVVPDDDTLTAAYRRMQRQILIQERIDEAMEKLGDEGDGAVSVPADLKGQIDARQNADRTLRWDEVLREIAERDHDEVADD